MSDSHQSVLVARLDHLLATLDARATGLWRVGPEHLTQAAFRAAADMPAEVRDGFAEATRNVALDRLALSIVRAVVEGRAVVSRVDELSADDDGSGHWLRAFAAARSVAVPIRSAQNGPVVAVLSIAVPPECDQSDRAIAELVGSVGVECLAAT